VGERRWRSLFRGAASVSGRVFEKDFGQRDRQTRRHDVITNETYDCTLFATNESHEHTGVCHPPVRKSLFVFGGILEGSVAEKGKIFYG
jgi:hypothetical protein